MADTNTDWTLDGLNNPLLLQERLLDRLESDTGNVVVDPNNAASVLMEAFASTTSGLIRTIENQVRPAIYPARANNASDLYKHLSDYDYIDVFASPSTTVLQLVVDKTYILVNSVAVPGADYNKLIIPSTTKFTVGQHTFGIYYPIEIRSSRSNGRFSVVYDTTNKNPLYTLSNNALEYDVRKYSGHDLVFIKIPVYQFDLTEVEDVLVAGTGYRRVIEHPDRFYAIRCSAEVLQNPGHDDTEEDIFATKELSLCVSGQAYDPNTVTAVFTPDLQNNQCIVEIPYVYFSNGLIRGTLRTELYTTKGELSYVIPTDTEEVCTIDMFSKVTDEVIATYADPFKKMPALQVIPLSTTIVGGRNGMSYTELKNRVVTGTIKSKTLQTPDDIDAYFANQGYITTKLRDGITDRIFIAHAAVRNTNGEIIGADSIGTLFDFRSEVIGDYDTIVTSGADTFTVLPSTMYKLDSNKGICTPLTQLERLQLESMVPSEKVQTFNETMYTVSPYHLQVDISSRYPTTVTYDMTDVDITSREFISDQIAANCQLILNASTLTTVRGDVKNDYRLTFRVSRAGLDDVQAVVSSGDAIGRKNFRCLVGIKNDDGMMYFGEATWDSWTGEYDIFHFDITSNYKFHQANNNHTVMVTVGKNPETDIFLTAEVRVILLINGDINSTSDILRSYGRYLVTDFTNVSTSIIESTKNFYALSENKLMCKFGSVVNEIDQRINLAYSEMQYLKYPTTKFKSLATPIYDRNSDGTLKIDDGEFKFTRSTDTVYNTDKTYYTATHTTGTSGGRVSVNSGDYVQVAVPETPGDVNPSALSYFELVHETSVRELYPIGTLTCVTKTTEEAMILNYHTVMNYIGCTAEYTNSEGETETIEVGIDTPNPANYCNKTLSVKDAPLIPRFFVNSAQETNDGEESAIVGKYELADAKTAPSLSSPTNLWYQAGLNGYTVVNVSGLVEYTPFDNRIYSEDALYYVFNTILGKYDTDITSATYGTFTPSNKQVIDGSYAPIKTGVFTAGIKYWKETTVGSYTYTLLTPGTDYTIGNPISEYSVTVYLESGDHDDPTATVLADKGTFLLVNNDMSNYDNEVPTIGTLSDDQKGTPYSPLTVGRSILYYCSSSVKTNGTIVSSAWVPVAQGSSQTAMGVEIWNRTRASKWMKNYGYVYVAEAKKRDEEENITTQIAVSFLNTKEYNGVKVPDFTRFDLDKWTDHAAVSETTAQAGRVYMYVKYTIEDGVKVYGEADEILIDVGGGVKRALNVGEALPTPPTGCDVRYVTVGTPEYGWMTYVNKWPWDSRTWWTRGLGSSIVWDPTIGDTSELAGAVVFTVDSNFEAAFDSARLIQYCEYTSGQVRLLNGQPQEDPDCERTIQYLISMIQMDAKLGQTTSNQNTHAFPNNVTQVIRSHTDLLGECRQNMFTNTRLFFEPRPSLNNAMFELGDGRSQETRLDVSVGFKLYVTPATSEDSALIESIHDQIVEIIDEQIEATRMLNCAHIATKIIENLGDSVLHVDILGINGDVDLQTIKCVDPEAQVHLGHRLKLLNDEMTIDIDRALTLEIVVSED